MFRGALQINASGFITAGKAEMKELKNCIRTLSDVKGREMQQMKNALNEDLIYEVLSVVEEIPEGRVATYGQIARLIGRDRNARLVGKILSMSGYYGNYPCHRVVNHAGRTAPGFRAQRELLEDEGVGFRANGCVDLKKYQWDC